MVPAIIVIAAEQDPSAPLGGLGEIAPLLDLGLSGVLIGVVIWFIRRREALVSSGEWVPRRELDYLRQDRDTRLAEKDAQIERGLATIAEWRAAHETSERTRELQAGHIRDLVDAFRSSPERFFDTFRDVLERGPDDVLDRP